MRKFLIVAAAIAVALSACTDDESSVRKIEFKESPSVSSGGSSVASGDSADLFTVAPLQWEECGRLECATLEVPLDWDEPSGETIELAINRRLARGEAKASLLTNPGGPGGSGIEYNEGSIFADEITEQFDIVSWDPRGVGISTAVTCGDLVDEFQLIDSDPDNDAEQSELNEAAKAVAEECEEENGDLLPHVGTVDVARDLDAIREALGEDKLTYVGFSYGTAIGVEYIKQFPQNVRAIVLDGVVDPTLDFSGWLAQQTTAFEETMNKLFKACDDDSSCGSDDLGATYDRVAEALEKEPAETASGIVTPATLATAAIYASYDPFNWSRLHEALIDAEDGDYAEIYSLARAYTNFGGFTSYAAVECIDTPHPVGPEAYEAFVDDLEEISPRFGGAVGNELLPCAFWSASAAEAPDQTIDVSGLAPVLVLGNTGDAATPYGNSVKVADMLEGAQLVTYNGEGHISYGRSRCVNDAVANYLIALEVPQEDPDC